MEDRYHASLRRHRRPSRRARHSRERIYDAESEFFAVRELRCRPARIAGVHSSAGADEDVLDVAP